MGAPVDLASFFFDTEQFQDAESWKFCLLGIFALHLSLPYYFSALGQAPATWCLSHCSDLPAGLCPQSCDSSKASCMFLPNFLFSDVNLIMLLPL